MIRSQIIDNNYYTTVAAGEGRLLKTKIRANLMCESNVEVYSRSTAKRPVQNEIHHQHVKSFASVHCSLLGYMHADHANPEAVGQIITSR